MFPLLLSVYSISYFSYIFIQVQTFYKDGS